MSAIGGQEWLLKVAVVPPWIIMPLLNAIAMFLVGIIGFLVFKTIRRGGCGDVLPLRLDGPERGHLGI